MKSRMPNHLVTTDMLKKSEWDNEDGPDSDGSLNDTAHDR